MRNKFFKTLAVVSVAALTGIAACGDDEDENGGDNGGDNGGGDTPARSLQQEAFDAGLINTVGATDLEVTSTLAVTGTFTPATPATPLPAGFEAADYYGAVDPSVADGSAWWQGWTYINSAIDGGLPGANFHPLQAEIEGSTIDGAATNGCAGVNSTFTDGGTVEIFGDTFPVCVISGDIDADTTLVNNHVFVLSNFVNVGNGDEANSEREEALANVTLTIPAGTQIYASEGSAISLTATRGSQIVAQGSAMMPVMLSAVAIDTSATDVITGDPTNLMGTAQWGGVVLSGRGITSDGEEVATEAAPSDGERFFGGTDNEDSSGSLEYIIIAESGFAFTTDEEVQGLTIEAAGSGTTIDFVQVLRSDDDCVEWFGGAADASHIICNGVEDDGLDIDQGYVGNIQFAIVRMGAMAGNHGIESDGQDLNTPFTAPNIANLTVLGNAGSQETVGALHRENFQGKVYRSVFTDDLLAGGEFDFACLNVDDEDTLQVNGGTDGDDAIEHFDSVFNCSGGSADGIAPADDDG